MTNENLPVASLVSNETGEIEDVFYEGDSYKKTSKEQKEYINNNVINFNKGAKFVKLYDEVLEELSNKLTLSEFNLAIRLAKHVSYNDCILRTNGHGNGKILTEYDLSDILNINYKTLNRLLNQLIKKGVLGRHETGCIDLPNKKIKCFTCNPYIYMRGADVNKTIVEMFNNTGWELYIGVDKENLKSNIC